MCRLEEDKNVALYLSEMTDPNNILIWPIYVFQKLTFLLFSNKDILGHSMSAPHWHLIPQLSSSAQELLPILPASMLQINAKQVGFDMYAISCMSLQTCNFDDLMCMAVKYLFFKIILFNYVKNGKGNTSVVVFFTNFLMWQCSFQDGIWVTSSDYVNASPDPLRNCAENLVNEMNSKHLEDVHRFCDIYVDSGFKVCIWKLNYFSGRNILFRSYWT